MAATPFGRETRVRVLNEYFDQAGKVTEENAWEHVYRCLLWENVSAGLAHIYDSNHMQPGGGFHSRAVRFTDLLCEKLGTDKQGLFDQIDYLFKGCIAEFKRQLREQPQLLEERKVQDSELFAAIWKILTDEGIADERAEKVAANIEQVSRDFFTLGNKRKNALGEGFEDLLEILLQRVSNVPAGRIGLRRGVSKLPGFRRSPIRPQGSRREPKPDIAIFEGDITHVICTAKWSMRQDREQQFLSEYNAFQANKVQSTELQYVLITNEFDTARLSNVARAMPGGLGGYIFHQIYHINHLLLQETQQAQIGEVEHHIGTRKIQSLSDFLRNMKAQFGES